MLQMPIEVNSHPEGDPIYSIRGKTGQFRSRTTHTMKARPKAEATNSARTSDIGSAGVVDAGANRVEGVDGIDMSAGQSPEAVLAAIGERLLKQGVTPTRQRLEIASELLREPVHLSADEVHARVQSAGANVSRATVYNTLSLMVERGLIRQVVTDPGKVFYDSNTEPHHHFYDTDAGELIDIAVEDIAISGLPELPADKKLEGIDVIVRVSSRQ